MCTYTSVGPRLSSHCSDLHAASRRQGPEEPTSALRAGAAGVAAMLCRSRLRRSPRAVLARVGCAYLPRGPVLPPIVAENDKQFTISQFGTASNNKTVTVPQIEISLRTPLNALLCEPAPVHPLLTAIEAHRAPAKGPRPRKGGGASSRDSASDTAGVPSNPVTTSRS